METDRQHPAAVAAIRRVGAGLRPVVGVVDVLLGVALQALQDVAGLALEVAADAQSASAEHDQRTVAGNQPGDAVVRVGQGAEQVVGVPRASRQGKPALGGNAQQFGDAPLLEAVDDGAADLREDLERHAHRVGNQLGRHVVAGEQAPELAADHDGYAHRGAHAHVGQVLAVDRRNAAQHAVAQVEGPAAFRIERRKHAHRDVGHVGDQPDRVLDVQAARLCRDIRGRVTLAEVAFQVVATAFGDHLAGIVMAEAVGHHPVVAGHPAQLLGDAAEQGRGVVVQLHLGDDALGVEGEGRDRQGIRGADLELQVEHVLVAVPDHIEQVLADPRLHAVRPGAAAEQSVLEHAQDLGAHLLFLQVAARRGDETEQRLDVLARGEHHAIRAQGEQRAVRLDRAGHVDGFVLAVRQGYRGDARHLSSSLEPRRSGFVDDPPTKRNKGSPCRVLRQANGFGADDLAGELLEKVLPAWPGGLAVALQPL